MNTLVFLQGFSVSVLIATLYTSLFDLEMYHLDVSLENNQVFEGFSTGGTFVRPLTHMVDPNMPFHDVFPVKMSIAKIASEPAFLLVCSFNMLFQVMVQSGFVATNMTNFEITFLWMTVTDMFLQSLLQSMGVFALVTFPWLLCFMLVHYMLLHMFVILSRKKFIRIIGLRTWKL